jgi:hypothetical protein
LNTEEESIMGNKDLQQHILEKIPDMGTISDKDLLKAVIGGNATILEKSAYTAALGALCDQALIDIADTTIPSKIRKI